MKCQLCGRDGATLTEVGLRTVYLCEWCALQDTRLVREALEGRRPGRWTLEALLRARKAGHPYPVPSADALLDAIALALDDYIPAECPRCGREIGAEDVLRIWIPVENY